MFTVFKQEVGLFCRYVSIEVNNISAVLSPGNRLNPVPKAGKAMEVKFLLAAFSRHRVTKDSSSYTEKHGYHLWTHGYHGH